MADKKISEGTLRAAAALTGADVFEVELPATATQFKTTLADVGSFILGNGVEKSADPSDPAEGQWVMWMSDGTGSGGDGDILMKVTAAGVTKFITLLDFSAVP